MRLILTIIFAFNSSISIAASLSDLNSYKCTVIYDEKIDLLVDPPQDTFVYDILSASEAGAVEQLAANGGMHDYNGVDLKLYIGALESIGVKSIVCLK